MSIRARQIVTIFLTTFTIPAISRQKKPPSASKGCNEASLIDFARILNFT